MSSMSNEPVRHRRVFYIPGYDPFPPRRYRELYRREAVIQSDISGYDIAIKSGIDGGGFGWQVAAHIEDQPVRTDIEVLVWSDIVQNSRPESVSATYWSLIKTVWIYISTGVFFRLMQLRKGPVIAALYPVFALLLQALFATGLGWSTSRIVDRMTQEMLGTSSNVIWGALLGIFLGIGVSVVSLRWFREKDGIFFAYYLMHDFAFAAAEKGAYPAALEHRLMEFRARVEAAMTSGVDEILIVGHSSGAHLAVSLLSDLFPSDTATRFPGQTISFLSLGHVVPMISFLPKAHRLRRDLLNVSQNRQIDWVDVSAPGDGGCFALCDPVCVSGQSSARQSGPLVLSAAFSQTLSAERRKSLRWRFFRLHFQYLCAFDRPNDYDYFKITAGPLRLADRYKDRKSSPSKIDKTISAFTSVTP
ncbi:MAG: hypothetical protein ABJQ70_20255 [Roseobacter sp.]